MSVAIEQQIHGYRSGHQLLDSSITLPPSDQEIVDRLSDMAGPLRPNERFDPYLTAYPLPSGLHFILAQTVQDLAAPRAGCVVTRSLVIPQGYWADQAEPFALAALLAEQDRTPAPISALSASNFPSPTSLPAQSKSELLELTEALFLEKRAPIVVFDAPDPRLVALRLLTALWPGLRSTFSLCTFALAPRYLSARPFDLLFAPKSARSRFSDWEGRRLDAHRSGKSPRHRWSELISSRIFEGPTPHLIDGETLAILAADQDSNESVLRLSLMWDELKEKSQTSPTAVLGMLDIANSRDSASSGWPMLQPAIYSALSLAVRTLPPTDAWGFIRALFGKTTMVRSRAELLDHIAKAAADLTGLDAGAALDAFAALDLPVSEEEALIEAMAPRLDATEPQTLAAELDHLSGAQIGEFCRRSASCRSAVMDSQPSPSSSLLDKLVSVLELDPDQAKRLQAPMIDLVIDPAHAPLILALLRDADEATILTAIQTVWRKQAAHCAPVATALVGLSSGRNSTADARDAFASTGDDGLTDWSILELSGDQASDLEWFLHASEIAGRRGALLAAWLGRLSDRSLAQLLSAKARAEPLLAEMNESGAPIDLVVRVLTTDSLPTEILFDIGPHVFGKTTGRERQVLANALIARGIAQSTGLNDGRLQHLMELTTGAYDLEVAIGQGVARAPTGAVASLVLEAIDRGASTVRHNAVAAIESIALAVSQRREFDLTPQGALALSNLVEASRPTGAYLHACSILLPQAIRTQENPAASTVITSTFPAVYHELRNDSDWFDIWKVFGFSDWDKCKTARRDLVRAFLHSRWPPLDLVRIALATPDADRFLKRLLKEPGGLPYFKQIGRDLNKLPPAARAVVANVSRAVGKLGVVISDWET